MQDYLIQQLLVAIASVLRRHGGKWVYAGRRPVGLLIIGQYLRCSLAVMGQMYLPSDKALLLLWQGNKAITIARTNNLLVPPITCMCVCAVTVATDGGSPAWMPSVFSHVYFFFISPCVYSMGDFEFRLYLGRRSWQSTQGLFSKCSNQGVCTALVLRNLFYLSF